MLQNRVDPFGNIIQTAARGTLMGNRGVIHDDHKKIIRPFKLKSWITCVLEFKDRRREVMAPNRWTELFFLDEATSFSAGHRPCAECRREDFNRFKRFWIIGNPKYAFDKKTSIIEIDKVLHTERIEKKKGKVNYEENVADLPDGTFVLYNSKPHLLAENELHLWTPFGYTDKTSASSINKIAVLTPASIVNAFRAGYACLVSK